MSVKNIIDSDSYNLATNDKFILNLPLGKVIDGLGNSFQLNVYSFEIPELMMGEVYVNYRGYKVPLPNGVREEDKTLNVGLNLSSNLIQYARLYQWFAQSSRMEERGIDETDFADNLIPANLSLLNESLDEIKLFQFEDCWLQRLGKLTFEQSAQDGAIIKCQIAIKYFKSDFDFESSLSPA
jgi:hypothetical protein